MLADDVIEDEFERPGFEQAKPDFGGKREEGEEDKAAILPDMGPEVARDPPEAGQTLRE